jgi:hypothetical protein
MHLRVDSGFLFKALYLLSPLFFVLVDTFDDFRYYGNDETFGDDFHQIFTKNAGSRIELRLVMEFPVVTGIHCDNLSFFGFQS